MSRVIYILLVMAMVVCSTALSSRAAQSEQEILNSLNAALATLSFATQDPRSNFIDEWNNSYQFAVKGDQFIITYRTENTLFKGAERKSYDVEAGTYRASLDLLSNASVLPFSQTLGIAIICNDKEKCFTQDSSGQYEHKGKISSNKFSKSSHRINLMLPEDLIGPTIDLLQELLYP